VALKDALRNSQANPAWYPGVHDRHAAFCEAHPDCELISQVVPDGRSFSAFTLPGEPGEFIAQLASSALTSGLKTFCVRHPRAGANCFVESSSPV
jgi:hypothetical protein